MWHMYRWIKTNLNSPDYLEACDTVLVVLCVGLQIVDVDVGQAGEQQLKLLLVEDRNQPGKKRKVVKICEIERSGCTLGCFTCDTLQKIKIPNPARNC